MNVLVPFDVGPVSERAARTALEMFGGQDDVRMIAVHVSSGEDPPAQLAANELEAMGERQEVAVEATVHRVDEDESKDTVRDTITELVDSHDIDLVVLGYEEKSLLERLLRTDTSERMLENHGVPVLVVP